MPGNLFIISQYRKFSSQRANMSVEMTWRQHCKGWTATISIEHAPGDSIAWSKDGIVLPLDSWRCIVLALVGLNECLDNAWYKYRVKALERSIQSCRGEVEKGLTCSLYRPFLAFFLHRRLPVQSHGFFDPVLYRLCVGGICVAFWFFEGLEHNWSHWQKSEDDAVCRIMIAIVSSLQEAQAFLWTSGIADRKVHLLATVRTRTRELHAAGIQDGLTFPSPANAVISWAMRSVKCWIWRRGVCSMHWALGWLCEVAFCLSISIQQSHLKAVMRNKMERSNE
jgi:hypothetical protein